MSELKAFNSERIYWAVEQVEQVAGDIDSLRLDDNLFYIKSEADKYIHKLEEKCFNDLQAAEDSFKSILELNRKEISHHKYKRCLAMARWCGDACDKWMMRKAKAIGLGKDGVEEYHRARRKLSHYMRWQNRWMKLAEKFKEAK